VPFGEEKVETAFVLLRYFKTSHQEISVKKDSGSIGLNYICKLIPAEVAIIPAINKKYSIVEKRPSQGYIY